MNSEEITTVVCNKVQNSLDNVKSPEQDTYAKEGHTDARKHILPDNGRRIPIQNTTEILITPVDTEGKTLSSDDVRKIVQDTISHTAINIKLASIKK